MCVCVRERGVPLTLKEDWSVVNAESLNHFLGQFEATPDHRKPASTLQPSQPLLVLCNQLLG